MGLIFSFSALSTFSAEGSPLSLSLGPLVPLELVLVGLIFTFSCDVPQNRGRGEGAADTTLSESSPSTSRERARSSFRLGVRLLFSLLLIVCTFTSVLDSPDTLLIFALVGVPNPLLFLVEERGVLAFTSLSLLGVLCALRGLDPPFPKRPGVSGCF